MEGDPSTAPALYNYPDYQIFKANKQGTNWYDAIYRKGIIQNTTFPFQAVEKNRPTPYLQIIWMKRVTLSIQAVNDTLSA